MTYDEKVAGAALLNNVARAVSRMYASSKGEEACLLLALERLARFFGTEIVPKAK